MTSRGAAIIAAAALGLSACAGDDASGTLDEPTEQTTGAEPTADPEDDGDPTGPADEPSTDHEADPADPDPDEGDAAEPVDPDHDHPTDLEGGADVLTPDDAGGTVQLSTGDTMSLRLQSGLAYNVATLDPDVVDVVPVDHFDDPGYAEWLLEATGPGTTEVVASGAGTDELRYEVEVTD